MSETCYLCDKPATYTCEAAGCDHRMCQEHSVLRTSERGNPPSDGETEEHDHQHLCLDHA